MNKSVFNVLLCLLLVMAIVMPAAAVENDEIQVRKLSVSNPEEFLAFAENCRLDSYSENLEVDLEVDLDLTGVPVPQIPLFCGKFNGNGHKISGVSVESSGSYQGLFRYIAKDAIVQDLKVEALIHPQGSRNAVGGIAGSNAGIIRDCVFTGEVSGSEFVGGIAGKNTVTGIVENSRVEGQIHGDHFVGGIVGENHGVIRLCTNHAMINTTAKQNDVAISDITLDTLMNAEAANTTTDIGGIAGISSGVLRGCENRGSVGYPQMGYNIGGISGTQSGYLVACYNYGNIQGRKEVGGIVGQMEPISQIDFTEDTLQILQEQLYTMSGLLDRTTGNVRSGSDQLSGQISSLRNQTQTAKDAVEALIPSRENPHLPDMDAILAAQNTLSNTMDAMPQTMQHIAASSENMISSVVSDLTALSDLLSTMCKTIYNASENIGGTVRDISDQDTPELQTGKVTKCINYGNVLADLNAGGIAGAMAMENDLDIVKDWQQSGEISMNFQSDVRAVVIECQNAGLVTGKKHNLGGLVGWQSMGLVKNSTNTGKVDGSAAKYVGGIVGLSSGYLREVSANCEVIGQEYLGGIAGSAMVVTDSLAHVKLTNGLERVGGIVGWVADNQTGEDAPIRNNYYLAVDGDCGAIDGISYDGLAQPMTLAEFLAIENLPDTFKTMKIRFLFEDGSMTEISVPVGESLDKERIPDVPEKAGYSGSWKNLHLADLDNILFDMTFEAEYAAHSSTISSAEAGEKWQPIAILEGSFSADAEVVVLESDAAPELQEKQVLLDSWHISSNEPADTVHLLFANAEESMQLYIRASDGAWNQQDFHISGSYLVFEMDTQDLDIALVQQAENYIPYYLAAGGAVLLLALLVWIIGKRKRPKTVDNPKV